MTFTPELVETEIRCPFGFTVHAKPTVPRAFGECEHRCCHPDACERLRRLGIATCEELKAKV